ncbi:MAG: DUF58 domain-containing protein [Mariprofundaceae bacterium]
MSSATRLELSELIAMQQQASALMIGRKHIRAALSGAHLSRLRGRGMEFDEVRVYQAGDEVSSIDWKVTARKGTVHVKLFREERERPVLICLDYRKSMFFATQGCLKSIKATQAASLLAWHGIAQGDRVGASLFSECAHRDIKPARGRRSVLRFLHECCEHTAWKGMQDIAEPMDLVHTIQRLRRHSKPGSLVYILSDFRGLNEASMTHLALLSRHSDVVLIAVHDVIETGFPKYGDYPVFNGKEHFNLHANASFQKHVRQQYQQRLELLQQLQTKHGIQLICMSTQDDVVQTMREHVCSM